MKFLKLTKRRDRTWFIVNADRVEMIEPPEDYKGSIVWLLGQDESIEVSERMGEIAAMMRSVGAMPPAAEGGDA